VDSIISTLLLQTSRFGKRNDTQRPSMARSSNLHKQYRGEILLSRTFICPHNDVSADLFKWKPQSESENHFTSTATCGRAIFSAEFELSETESIPFQGNGAVSLPRLFPLPKALSMRINTVVYFACPCSRRNSGQNTNKSMFFLNRRSESRAKANE
jgi:hypothetical protein